MSMSVKYYAYTVVPGEVISESEKLRVGFVARPPDTNMVNAGAWEQTGKFALAQNGMIVQWTCTMELSNE